MKDEDFEELKNYKSKMTETKVNFTNQKGTRNANSRLRSSEKTKYDTKLESVNKKWFRAQSINTKSFQVKNKLSEISVIKGSTFDKKSNNISLIEKINKKK